MKVKRYKEEWVNVIRQNVLFLFLLGISSVVNVFLAFALVNALDKKLVVLLPPKLETEVSFSGSKPSIAYIRSMGFYATSLIASYTPSTIKFQFDYFLSMVPSSYFHNVKKKLDEIRKEEVKYQVSQEFGTNGNIKVYEDRIEIEGVLRRYISSKLIDTLPVRYIIYYRISDIGKFEVLGYVVKKI